MVFGSKAEEKKKYQQGEDTSPRKGTSRKIAGNDQNHSFA